MAKLHELLAIETDTRGQAESCRTGLKTTFEKKQHHFTKKVVTVKSLVTDEPPKQESQLNLQTSVHGELKWISEKLEKAMDLGYQIDVANTQATSDVVLDDGTTLLTAVPTTALLRLEHRIDEIKDLIHAVPTLDPAKNFEPDASEGPGIYRARDDERTKGEKTFSFVVMTQPTDKFPAQVKELMLDKPVISVLTQEWSSLITVAEKAAMLDRVEEVLRAVKKARSRANSADVDVKKHVIGANTLEYIFGV